MALGSVLLAASCTSRGPDEPPVPAIHGLTLPHGAIDLAPRGGPEIRATAAALAVEGAEVLALSGGRPAPGAFVDHVAPALHAALAPLARRGREQAARDGGSWDARATVLADRATPFATLADTLYTAARAGFDDFDLVVRDGPQLRGQPLAVPRRWFPDDGVIRDERPLQLVFVVRADGVEASIAGQSVRTFPRAASCDPWPASCHDLPALAAFAAATKKLYPMEVVATFRVEGEVSLQAVVALVDAVRGEGCRLSGALAGEALPSACLFWQAVVDREPPLPVVSGPR